MRVTAPWAALAAACWLAGASAQTRPQVDLACEAWGDGPQLQCTLRLARDGAPLQGAQVTLGATMPSMPMAHRVATVAAAPTGRPGEYRGVLALEMTGSWAVQVDIAGPPRERVVRVFDVPACDDGRRCAARPAGPVGGAAATPASGHTHNHTHTH